MQGKVGGKCQQHERCNLSGAAFRIHVGQWRSSLASALFLCGTMVPLCAGLWGSAANQLLLFPDNNRCCMFFVFVVTSLLSAAVGGDDGAAVPFWSGCLSVRFSVVHTLHCGPISFWGRGCNSLLLLPKIHNQFLIGDQAKHWRYTSY